MEEMKIEAAASAARHARRTNEQQKTASRRYISFFLSFLYISLTICQRAIDWLVVPTDHLVHRVAWCGRAAAVQVNAFFVAPLAGRLLAGAHVDVDLLLFSSSRLIRCIRIFSCVGRR